LAAQKKWASCRSATGEVDFDLTNNIHRPSEVELASVRILAFMSAVKNNYTCRNANHHGTNQKQRHAIGILCIF
jgi:hypothetical protein